jgi:hypothetical protein
MAMNEVDRRAAMACLSAMEANGAELLGIEGWRERIGPDRRREFQDFCSRVREYEHDLENLGVVPPG